MNKTYIEKVTKAKEIQALCKYKKGDWFWSTKWEHDYVLLGDIIEQYDFDERKAYLLDDGYKWTPILEQLFEILQKCFEKNLTHHYGWESFTKKAVVKFLGDQADDLEEDEYIDDIKEFLLDNIMLVFHDKSWNPIKKEWEEISGNAFQ